MAWLSNLSALDRCDELRALPESNEIEANLYKQSSELDKVHNFLWNAARQVAFQHKLGLPSVQEFPFTLKYHLTIH